MICLIYYFGNEIMIIWSKYYNLIILLYLMIIYIFFFLDYNLF